MQHQSKVYNELNNFLKDFLNRVDPQKCGGEYQITESRFIEDLLGMELADTSQIGTFKKLGFCLITSSRSLLFVRDVSEMGYSSVFLYGNEWALMSFEMLLFCLIDLFWHNRILASLVTFSCSKLISQLTNVYFTHQLARSSLVDSRFLI
jgi:meckelin